MPLLHGFGSPFVRTTGPAHTAAQLSLPIELAHDKGILLVGHYRIGRPANGGNNAGEESPGEFPKGVTLPLGKILARRGEPRYETSEAAGRRTGQRNGGRNGACRSTGRFRLER